MILEKLTVCGFSSYLEKQEIDLERYYGGIFMITGDTGAGKTTIFDAVIYALFGRPSGSARSEFTLHNISAGAQECFAELTFSVNGRRWTVHRSVRADSSDRKNNRCYLDSQGEHIDGKSGVDEKIRALLSLDYGAFCRISMLAQGEFAQFLTMKSDERGKALRAVFDTERYERFERYVDSLAKEAAAELKDLRGQYALLLDTQLANVMELSAELRVPERCAELCGEIERAEGERTEQLDELRAQGEELRAQFAELQKQTEQLRAVNERFDRLLAAREALAAVEAERPAAEQARQTLARAERAERVKPAAQAAQEQHSRLEECERSLSQAQEAAQSAAEELSEAQRAMEEKPALTAEQQALSEAVPTLRSTAQAWEENAQLVADEQKARGEADRLRAEHTEITNEREGLIKQLDGLRGEISAAEKTAAQLPALEAAVQKSQDECESCARLLESAEKITAKRREEKRQAKKALEAAQGAEQAAQAAGAAKESYFANLAGVLAKEVKSGCACPVCGSAEHPSLAHLPESAADKEECEELEAAAESARKALAEAEKKLAAIQSDLNGRLESAAAEYERLTGEAPENGDITLCTERLGKRREECEGALCGLRESLEAAREGGRLATELKRDEQSLAGTLADADKRLAKAAEELRGSEGALAAAGALLSENTARLEKLRAQCEGAPESAEQAQTALKQAQERQEELAELIPRLDERFNAADKANAAAHSALEKERAAAEAQRAAASEKQAALEAAAAENGFASPQEAAGALLPEKEAQRLRERCEDCERRLAQAKANAAALEAELDGRERTDLAQYEERLAELSARRDAASEQAGALGKTLEGLRESRKVISARAEEFMGKTSRAAMLEKLGNIVGGKSDVKAAGKISLERYVQGRMLDKVLLRANTRLSELSGGRYRLMRVDTGERRSSAAGLDIMVEDLNKGQNALRPVASLSGGEEFLASFALAVGLSDYTMELNGGVSTGLLFVDEGFSSLDENTFSTAMNVLNEISGDNRTIGVVSHVREVRERFPESAQIIVKKGRKGSVATNGGE